MIIGCLQGELKKLERRSFKDHIQDLGDKDFTITDGYLQRSL